MIGIKIIEKLKEEGVYSEAIKKGIIPLKVAHYYDLYNEFCIRLIVNKGIKNPIEKSEQETATKFKVSEITVHRAVKFMRE